MAAFTWPSNSNLPQTHKKAKYLKLTQLLSRWSVPTTFHGGIVSKLPTQTWNKAKISPHIPLKTALSTRENHSTNDAFWLVESRDVHRQVCSGKTYDFDRYHSDIVGLKQPFISNLDSVEFSNEISFWIHTQLTSFLIESHHHSSLLNFTWKGP